MENYKSIIKIYIYVVLSLFFCSCQKWITNLQIIDIKTLSYKMDSPTLTKKLGLNTHKEKLRLKLHGLKIIARTKKSYFAEAYKRRLNGVCEGNYCFIYVKNDSIVQTLEVPLTDDSMINISNYLREMGFKKTKIQKLLLYIVLESLLEIENSKRGFYYSQ